MMFKMTLIIWRNGLELTWLKFSNDKCKTLDCVLI